MLRKFYIVFIVLWVSSAESFSQLNANFSATPTSGCSPLLVEFSDLSTGNPTSWNWDFGNGNNSILQNPSAIYINPGKYTVKLVVHNAGGTGDSLTKLLYIEVFTNPTANFSANNVSGCLPLSVAFTDLSVKGSGTVNSWLWDFGDGSTSTLQNPAHNYTSSGTYTITLKVTDTNGCTNTLTITNYINVFGASTAVLAFSPSSLLACSPPQTITFTNTSTGSGLSYSWNFGDGNTSNSTSPSNTYFSSGTYTVTLVSTDANGCHDTLKETLQIINSPTVSFSASNTLGCIGMPVQFTDNSTPLADSWLWNFGDGQTSALKSPSHAYSSPGTYDISLTINYTGSNCTGTLTKNTYITIQPSAVASFSSDSSACSVPYSVSFTNTSTGATSYSWDFGDGSSSAAPSPTHVYTQFGTYTVKLIALNAAGCNDTLVDSDYIRIQKTALRIQPLTASGCIPLVVSFSDSLSTAGTVTGYQWNFGDGSSSTLPAPPPHTYSSVGNYTVSLIVTNSLGCSDTATATVKTGTPPVANFSANPRVACALDSIHFTNLSTGANAWHWYFGDGGQDTTENPVHQYRDTGYFNVSLVAIFNGCKDSIQFPDYIYINPPIARFSVRQDCINRNLVYITNTSISADSWFWNYGDGSTSTSLGDTTHLYASDGTYTIHLTVRNSKTGCMDSTSIALIIQPFIAQFAASPLAGCNPLSVTFTDQSTGALAWSWNFGDGQTGTAGGTFVHTYTDTGTFSVLLIISDQYGCKDTLNRPLYITVGKLVANFTIDSIYGCTTASVALSDSSLPKGAATSWLWEFGDGTTSTLENPQHTYSFAGTDTFTIRLVVKNSTFCSDSVVKQVILQLPPLPSSAFTVNDSVQCPGSFFIFSAQSANAAFTYNWNFGDGSPDNTTSNPAHKYAVLGTYTVTLTVKNAYGCTSVTTHHVYVENPAVNFTADTTSASCPVLVVSFTDLSTANAVAWKWYFGDGTNSTFQNPTHLYDFPGSYTVSLVVKTASGCSDSLTFPDYINVGGPTGTFSFNPDAGCPPLTVNFNGIASDPNLSFTWDFGDGSLGSGKTTTHTYDLKGVYHPRLILKDSAGCTVSYQSPDSIVITPLSVNAGADSWICLGDSVTLTGSGSGSSFSWTPAKGLSNPSVSDPLASPSQTTTYYLSTKTGSCSSMDSVTVFVNPFSPVVNFSFNTACLGDSTRFENSSSIGSGKISSWIWDFGDKTQSDSENIAHLYSAPGSYPVTLKAVSDSGCTGQKTQTITVYPNPVASFTDTASCQNVSVLFTDKSAISSGSITGWKWILGTGTASAATQNTSYSYPASGTYSVSLIVTSNEGCTDTVTRPLTIFPLPQIHFRPESDSGCVGKPLLFSDSSVISSGNLSAWQWNFGDGETSTLQNPEHAFLKPGNYSITLEVTSNKGCVSSVTENDLLTMEPSPIAAFVSDPSETDQFHAKISFFDHSTGAAGWDWSFGDGDSSTLVNPMHTYQDTGTYKVILLVINKFGCTDTTSKDIEITPVYTFYIPDAFTPNGDGINDIFNFKGINIVQEGFKLTIFDRWGILIFQTTIRDQGWDGRANYGEDIAQQDVYVYVITVEDVFQQSHQYLGHVTLIK